MEKLIQKKWARRGESSLLPVKESRRGAPAASRVRGGARPTELPASISAAELNALERPAADPERVASPSCRRGSDEVKVRFLANQKVIVTGRLCGRSLDLVASIQDDGSLQVKGFNGTLPTDLVSRQAGGTGVQIGGRRDGVQVQAVVCPRAEGGMALTERRGNETFISVGEAVVDLHAHMLDIITDLPRDAARLFQATLLYLALRAA